MNTRTRLIGAGISIVSAGLVAVVAVLMWPLWGWQLTLCVLVFAGIQVASLVLELRALLGGIVQRSRSVVGMRVLSGLWCASTAMVLALSLPLYIQQHGLTVIAMPPLGVSTQPDLGEVVHFDDVSMTLPFLAAETLVVLGQALGAAILLMNRGRMLGLTRFGGHLSYGGYDVQTDGRHTQAPATPPAVH
jgi:hypothetical protein